MKQIAEIEDRGNAAGGADDVSVLRGGRLWRAEHKKNDGKNESCAFHSVNPEGFSYPWITRLLAQLNALLVSRGRTSEPMVRVCLSVQTEFPAGLVLSYQDGPEWR